MDSAREFEGRYSVCEVVARYIRGGWFEFEIGGTGR